MKRVAVFDAADYLDDDTAISEYHSAALEDENPMAQAVQLAAVL